MPDTRGLMAPAAEPDCPVAFVTPGMPWGSVATTTPAEGSNRQAPIVMAMTCFISHSFFRRSTEPISTRGSIFSSRLCGTRDRAVLAHRVCSSPHRRTPLEQTGMAITRNQVLRRAPEGNCNLPWSCSVAGVDQHGAKQENDNTGLVHSKRIPWNKGKLT